jgi:type IV secretion system protein VirB3
MRWGVTYTAMLLNAVSVMVIFLLSKNLLTLLLVVPVHGVCALLCARDVQYFELLQAWTRTRLPACFGNLRYWHASSYSPLMLDLPTTNGRRRAMPCARWSHRSEGVRS